MRIGRYPTPNACHQTSLSSASKRFQATSSAFKRLERHCKTCSCQCVPGAQENTSECPTAQQRKRVSERVWKGLEALRSGVGWAAAK
eukprot:14632515-Alexandrium_andersonii.AAC.1